MFSGICQVDVRMGHGHAILRQFSGMKGRSQFSQPCVATEHKVRCTLVRLWHVLGDLRQAPLFGHGEIATVLMEAAIEEGKQR